MQDQVKVQVQYTLTEGKLSFTDALYYDLATYPSIPKATMDAEKLSRFNAWKAEIAKPPPPIDVDKALLDCQTQIDYYTQLKAQYTAQKEASGGGK